ncbi:MAG TPA: hypothetical protein VMV81_00760, partial [Phycisphaerae bacterium]|nr:hypothetical protein [Phycisphaerae bacterium]
MEIPSNDPNGGRALFRWSLFIVLFLSGAASLAWGMHWVGERATPPAATPFAEDRIDHHPAAIGVGIALLSASVLFLLIHRREAGRWREEMTAFGNAVDGLSPRQRKIDLALASILGLFLEVVLIRWHGAEFRACAYLKNITLLACFLGLGLGFARARRPAVSFPIVLLLLAAQVMTIDVLSLLDADRAVRNPLDGEVFWGIGHITTALQACIFYGFFAALFVSTIAIFIPIGQLTGRLMDASRPISSYTINIAGSIVGVVLFALVSWLWLPPPVWFAVAAFIALWLMRPSRRGLCLSGLLSVVMIGWLGFEPRPSVKNVYSPYQRL